MFGDIGLSELFLVAVVAIFVVRPGDLPVIMRRLGLFYAYIQSFMGGVWGGWQEKLGVISSHNQELPQSGQRRAVEGKGD